MANDQPMERWTDEELLRAAQRGNESALNVVIVRSIPRLRRYVRYHCRNRAIPESQVPDICQETLGKALQFIGNCKQSGQRPLPRVSVAWLQQIAFNLMMDWLRSAGKLQFVADVRDQRSGESPISPTREEVEELEEIYGFFDWLPATWKEFMEFVYMENMTIPDAAERAGMARSSGYKIHQRALERLRDFVREHGQKSPIRNDAD
jgi:RNA polymerase sigma factor (sigma-70 family)